MKPALTFNMRLFYRMLILVASILVSACATLKPPEVDLVRFNVLPSSQRIMQEPTIRFLVREDGYEYCARITGIPVTPSSRPMACAFWNTKRKECTVVTPIETAYNYIGHEIRHCFDGSFHG